MTSTVTAVYKSNKSNKEEGKAIIIRTAVPFVSGGLASALR